MIGKRDARLKQNREKGEVTNKEKAKNGGPEIVREVYVSSGKGSAGGGTRANEPSSVLRRTHLSSLPPMRALCRLTSQSLGPELKIRGIIWTR